MALVRIHNPIINPRKPKTWTYAQAEDRKEKAEWAAREFQGDDERGDEIAEMSVEEYAEERGFEIVDKPVTSNPTELLVMGANPMNPAPREFVVPAGSRIVIRNSHIGENQMQQKRVGTQQPNNPAFFVDREDKLRRQSDRLKEQNKSLHGKLDAIQEILECDECTAEEHIEEIDDILAGKDGKDDKDTTEEE